MRSVSYYGTPQSNKLLNVCTQKGQAYYFLLHQMWTTKWLSEELKIEARFEHATVYSSFIQCSLLLCLLNSCETHNHLAAEQINFCLN